MCRGGGLHHVLVGGVRTAVADVLDQRTVEKADVLRDDGDGRAQTFLRDHRDILTIDQDAPRLHVVHTLHQSQQSRFAAARRSSKTDLLARANVQTEVFYNLRPAGIMEGHILEGDFGPGAGERNRAGAVAKFMAGPIGSARLRRASPYAA